MFYSVIAQYFHLNMSLCFSEQAEINLIKSLIQPKIKILKILPAGYLVLKVHIYLISCALDLK